MFSGYEITIIRDEGPPLAAMPGAADMNAIVLGSVLSFAVVVVAIYFFILLWYRHKVLVQMEGYVEVGEQYRGFSYRRLKDMEMVLQQKKLEKIEKCEPLLKETKS